MVEASSTQSPESKKSSEMAEASSTDQPDGKEVSDAMVEAASTQPDGKEDIQTEKLDSTKSSEIGEAASAQPDNKEINEMVKDSFAQLDNKESDEMVKAGSAQPDSQGVSVEAAPTQADGQDNIETDESGSTQSDGEESTETDESSSTQSDGEESTEMVKAASTQSAIQIKIEKNRKELAKELDQMKETTKNLVTEKEVDLERYRLLVRAIYEKNVKAIGGFINKNLEAVLAAHIDELGSTIFHLIVQVPGTDGLTEKLVSRASPKTLAQRGVDGFTALHSAAVFGNTKAVKLFVNKNTNLLTLMDDDNLLPVDHAIESGRHKETVEYLLSAHTARERRLDKDFLRASAYVLYGLISANHIDLAFGFLNQYPRLADRNQNSYWNAAINTLAKRDMGLPSRTWQRLIYHYMPVKVKKYNSMAEYEDIESQIQTSQKTSFFAKLQYKLWSALLALVPGIKCIHDQKLIHEQTLEIVRLMVAEVTWSFEEALESLKKPLLTAATLGNHRFVEEILKAYSYSFIFYDEHGHTLFHLAVLHRQENVFNLIHNQASLVKERTWRMTDDTEGSILHLAGRLVPSSKVPGAALQMQRELQWFKIVKDTFNPKLKFRRNVYEKTPQEVFTEEHEKLVKEGEKWMKDTATACSVVAALIITVVFATAYTFPGGINGEGLPNFLPKTSFKVLLVSVALALFSSTASVQMFLGILTSRYAEEDFLESLPKKLIIGLVTLFFSITSMMVAFASTFHIFLQPWKWVTFVMAVLVFVPVTLFAFMQFPLLVDIVKSTYGAGILKPMR